MLRKEEELDLNGFMSGQELADELYAQKTAGDVAVPAMTIHQVLRTEGEVCSRVQYQECLYHVTLAAEVIFMDEGVCSWGGKDNHTEEAVQDL